MKKSCFSIKCLFRVCFSAVEEGTVYELATSENRARLILISGVQHDVIERKNNNSPFLRNSITFSCGEMVFSTFPSPISSVYPFAGTQLK